MSDNRHLISILVENSPGELARIVGLFSGRGFNIDSLAVNTTTDPERSRVVLTTQGDARVVEQITKQLNKLVKVYKVHHLQGDGHVERELCLATIRASTPAARDDLERSVRLTGGKVLSFNREQFLVEVSGTEYEIDQFLEMVRPLGVRNMVRSAPVAIAKPSDDKSED